MESLRWDAYFVKDFVKSLKTGRGSIVRDADDLRSAVMEMERVRGELEGGLCLRRVEPFVADTERRYFVLDGVPFSSYADLVPAAVRMTVGRIPSRFYSVDAICRTDGVMRIVEIGDGQVSDLTGWDAVAFANIWSERFPDR